MSFPLKTRPLGKWRWSSSHHHSFCILYGRDFIIQSVLKIFAEVSHSQCGSDLWELRRTHTETRLSLAWSLYATVSQNTILHHERRKHRWRYYQFGWRAKRGPICFAVTLRESPMSTNSSGCFGRHKQIIANTPATVLNTETSVLQSITVIKLHLIKSLWWSKARLSLKLSLHFHLGRFWELEVNVKAFWGRCYTNCSISRKDAFWIVDQSRKAFRIYGCRLPHRQYRNIIIGRFG